MDTPEKPRRRWWRRKGWWVAAALWLLAVYPLSSGPAYDASNRGMIPHGSHLWLYQPLWEVAVAHGAERPLKRYVTWWNELARTQAPISN